MPYLPWLHQSLVELNEWPELQEAFVTSKTAPEKAAPSSEIDAAGVIAPAVGEESRSPRDS